MLFTRDLSLYKVLDNEAIAVLPSEEFSGILGIQRQEASDSPVERLQKDGDSPFGVEMIRG